MNEKEKFELMICIMKDLRGDWGYRNKERANKVKELAQELGEKKVVELVDKYFKNIAEYGNDDGRHFRQLYSSSGGYINAPIKIENFSEFSSEFLAALTTFCNYPEYRLSELKGEDTI